MKQFANAIPTAQENADAVEAELADDFAALPTASEISTEVQDALVGELDEILSNTDATQAKVDQL
jgi:hypothetical protein